MVTQGVNFNGGHQNAEEVHHLDAVFRIDGRTDVELVVQNISQTNIDQVLHNVESDKDVVVAFLATMIDQGLSPGFGELLEVHQSMVVSAGRPGCLGQMGITDAEPCGQRSSVFAAGNHNGGIRVLQDISLQVLDELSQISQNLVGVQEAQVFGACVPKIRMLRSVNAAHRLNSSNLTP